MSCPSPAAPFPLQLRNQKAASQSRAQEPQGSSSSKHRRYGRCPEAWAGGFQGSDPVTFLFLTRSSVCRLSSREKISLQDLSKERRPGGSGGPPIQDDDDGEEGSSGEGLGAGTPGSEGGGAGSQKQLVYSCDRSHLLTR